MAPRTRDTCKPIPKAVRVTAKSNLSKSTPEKTKKTITKTAEKKPMKMNNSTATPNMKGLPSKVSTPKPKENKPVLPPSSVTKSGKKTWQRRPKPAHSGVPVPEKMRKLLEKQFLNEIDF